MRHSYSRYQPNVTLDVIICHDETATNKPISNMSFDGNKGMKESYQMN